MDDYINFALWLAEEHHVPECESQPTDQECICIEVIEAKQDAEDDIRIQEYLDNN